MSIKEEYESLNGTYRKDKYLYQSLDIDDSVVDSLSIKDAIELYKNSEDSILYFGANWCPWCRSLLPVLIKYAKKNNKRITYINMDKKRPIYEKDGNNFKLIYGGDKEYHLIVDEFGDILYECVAKDGDKLINVPNTKNVSLPLVVFGNNGKLISYHYGTLDLKPNQTPYDLLDKDQEDELISLFETNSSLNAKTCSLDGECKN